MAELKMKPTGENVEQFLNSIADEQMRNDAFALLELMKEATQTEPQIWRGGTVGFGSYHYRYASGHEGDCFITGFAPRKQAMTLYLMSGLDQHTELLDKLGKHKTGKGCLYIKHLDEIHLPTLKKLVRQSVKQVKSGEKAAKAEPAKRAKGIKGGRRKDEG